ncbi:MFS transporter [Amycolatopsis sp. WAC 01375]|uniref:MFS transporter n=1 Tax=unclassified Amycolatopsis TaxID=2618356 RepID=UPI000F791056|nr:MULTISPECIES: MFS transporter [unclassified Amycolatopsis]RSM79086.1 MFS transporter [Amycolatopsis sp. WAC 01375]RSN37812.1 MFS transporter [Amycolatopsis sp. WAC 01416]
MSSTVESPPAVEEDGPRLSHRQIVTILIGLMSGMFLAALDQTIVGTSIVRIANDLNGFDLQAWITTAYLITSTIVTPIYGKLSDIYGRKPFYIAAISIFLIGSIASAFATSMYELAAFRAIQGLGAGGLMSLAMTIMGDIVPPRERARYQGYFLAVFGISTVLGPVLGGFFADFDKLGSVFGYDIAGWRWVFLINVPIAIVALFVVARVLNVPHQRHDHKIDWWGGLALVVAVVPFLIVAEQGNKWGWGSQNAIICYVIGAIGVVAFIFIEKLMKDAALIPLRLFKNSTFTVAIVGGVIVGVAMFGAIMMIPQYMQVVLEFSPTESGLLMIPLMAGIMSGSIISGQITSKTGRYKVFPVVGTLLIAAGSFFFAQVEYNSPLWHPLVAAAIIGLGLGACMQTLIIAVQNAGPRSDMGVSTASATFFRQIGGTAGVAVFLTILFNVLPGNITKAFGGNAPTGEGAAALGDITTNTSGIANLPEAIKTPVLIGFTESITTVFYVAGAVALLATLVLMFMKEIPLLGGSAPSAASALEGGEALLEEDDAPVETASEKTIVTAPVEPGKHAMTNGNGAYRAGSAQISGHVRRDDATNVAGAALTLIDHNGNQVARTHTNENGVYSFAGIVGGRYTLVASGRWFRPIAATLTATGAGVLRHDFELVSTILLSGVARTDGDRVVPDARITVLDSSGGVAAVARTDAEGNYTVSDLPAGTYTVIASGYPPATSRVELLGGDQAEHDVRLSYDQALDELVEH